MTSSYVLEMSAVRKGYQGLRPLRIAALTIEPGERVSVGGIDAAAAELLTSLVTGAALPDEGDVRIFGRRTADIASGDEWLKWLDRFGIVSERAVMLEGATLEQNLAIPFTLEIDPLPSEAAHRVEQLAAECGIPVRGDSSVEGARDWLRAPTAGLPPWVRMRAHLARALALSPQLLLIEHPTAGLDNDASASDALARDIARVTGARQLASLIVTQDEAFARRVAHRALILQGATGNLAPLRKKWF